MDELIHELQSPKRIGLSWDAILFLLLSAALFWSSEAGVMIHASGENDVSLVVSLTQIFTFDPLPAVLLIVLVVYIGADFWSAGQVQFGLKVAAVWFVILLYVFFPTVVAIIYRHNTVPYLYIHDGAIQVEEAVKFLLAGKNPYTESYVPTPMAQWPFHEPGVLTNPGLFHLIYLPFLLIASVPFYIGSLAWLGWFDQRFLYLGMLGLSAIMVPRVGANPRDKLAALMVLALNPLFVPFFIEGRNDIVVSFWLIVVILLVQRQRLVWAGIALALAAATKQTSWFLIPFFAMYITGTGKASDLVHRARVLLPAALVLAAILVPFLVWSPGAFLDDVINYQSGIASGAALYPIKSLGLGSLALGSQWIHRNTDVFPFWWFQVAFGGAGTIVMLYYQWRHNTLAQMLLNYAILLFIFSFFSRTFNDNHLGFALTWLILPSFVSDVSREK